MSPRSSSDLQAAAPELPVVPTRDLPPGPGVVLVDGGADVAVYAGHADGVELCLFDEGDTDGSTERRVPLRERTFGWWFAFVPGIAPGQRYGLRVDGAWHPDAGLRHNRDKLLLDPYARAIEGSVRWGPEVFGHLVTPDTWEGCGEQRSGLDSAGHMPRCVVVEDAFDWGADRRPEHSRAETVVYEVHVRNLTIARPGVPEPLRGTYAGLAHPDTVGHLTDLGVSAVELLPVHAFVDEPRLVRAGLRNHWGYNSIGFFAPHPAYAAADDPQGVVDELKAMVKTLHAAGIEVILDVVYNHTAEQEATGATLSFRGLDNRAYYRLDERGRDVDVTGCGNTLDLRHPVVSRLALDSLRRWANEYHVDGFRFDLAVALGRGRSDEYDPDHPFLVGLRTDPVLSLLKLVVEPWDVGLHGWRTGQFPPPFSEWNDRYRDAVRSFWLTDQRAQHEGRVTHGVREIATRLAGSRDLFGHRDRGPAASVNFVTAHDGFTLHDLTAYDHKHNEANTEGNRDGTDANRSWNHGTEGPSTDPVVLAARRRSMRNLLGTLLLSTGIPMLTAGDEFGHSQGGNNNPYCQDNETTWFDWQLQPWQEDLLATTRHLLALRHEHPVLRQRTWSTGRTVQADGSADLAWFSADGTGMVDDWQDTATMTLQMMLTGEWLGSASVLVVLHGGCLDTEVVLPGVPGGLPAWREAWDSTWERPRTDLGSVPPGVVPVSATSMQVYVGTDLP